MRYISTTYIAIYNKKNIDMGLFILIGIGFVCWILIKVLMSADKQNPQPQQQARQTTSVTKEVVYKIPRDKLLKLLGWSNTNHRYFIAENNIDIAVCDGYTPYPIVGTVYRHDVNIFDIGWFNGYAAIEPANLYDEYAIAIYRDDHKHIGYLPKGNQRLFEYIDKQGGYVHVYGSLSYESWSDRWFGQVIVESDHSRVANRNFTIANTDLTFYAPRVNITDFLNEKQK